MQQFEYTFGMEEEFFLAHASTGNLARRVPKRVIDDARRRLGDTVARELLQSQIELVSPVFADHAAAATAMRRLRRTIGAIAGARGLAIVAAGTHPLGSWAEQSATDAPRYDRLIEDFAIVGRRNAVCGLHVHVAVPPAVDRIEVMNRAMRWLPLFLGLSTSSPFWNRRRTGLLSYRQCAYDEWPRSGVPDFFPDEPAFRRFVALLQQGGALRDASFLWWVIRPSARYPTLELRIADACTRLDDALGIAALFRCLVALLVRRPELGAERDTATRLVVDENRWRAKRHGIDAGFIDDVSGIVTPLRAVLAQLRELADEEIARFDCADALAALDGILATGTSAHRQLEIYAAARTRGADRATALRAVAHWLTEATLQ